MGHLYSTQKLSPLEFRREPHGWCVKESIKLSFFTEKKTTTKTWHSRVVKYIGCGFSHITYMTLTHWTWMFHCCFFFVFLGGISQTYFVSVCSAVFSLFLNIFTLPLSKTYFCINQTEPLICSNSSISLFVEQCKGFWTFHRKLREHSALHLYTTLSCLQTDLFMVLVPPDDMQRFSQVITTKPVWLSDTHKINVENNCKNCVTEIQNSKWTNIPPCRTHYRRMSFWLGNLES